MTVPPIEYRGVDLPVKESVLRGGDPTVTVWTCGLCGCLVANIYAHTNFHAGVTA